MYMNKFETETSTLDFDLDFEMRNLRSLKVMCLKLRVLETLKRLVENVVKSSYREGVGTRVCVGPWLL